MRGSGKGLLTLACRLVVGKASPAAAGVPIPEVPLPQRVAVAECIVVGKVAALEDDLVEALPLLKIPGAGKLPYQIAVVKVESAVRGLKDLDVLRVGFIPPPASEGQTAPRTRRLAQVKLTVNQEGCFFLHKHPDESFYAASATADVLDRAKAKNFDKDVALVKRCARLLDDPDAGLRSKDATDRRLTAAMLILRYRRCGRSEPDRNHRRPGACRRWST